MDNNLLLACKVKIEDITIIFEDGSTNTIPSKNTFYMSIEKDYFNSFLPILNIKCLVNRQLYAKINKNQPKFKVTVNKFFVPANSTTFDKNSKTIMYKKFISDIFINVNDLDSSPDLYESIANRQDLVGSNRNEMEQDNIEIDLLLFTQKSLSYRKLNSKIFKDCNITSVILALSQLTGQNKMLLTYPDNRKVYNDTSIIIPTNLTFLGAIKFIQAVYGIYNHGYVLFNDFDLLYLIDKQPKCTAYKKGEYKRVYMEFNNVVTESGNIYGQYTDNKNMRYMINCISAPNIITNSTTTNELLYDRIHASNTYNGKSQVKDIDMTKSTSSKTTKVLDNKYNNNFIVNSSAFEIELNNYTLEIAFNEIDLDILTANKEYYLDIKIDKSEYKKLSGLFKITRLMAVYEKKDDDIFSSTIKAEFKRA